MLKKSMLSALILVTGLMSAQASAAFVATDWKAQGDGLATLDTDTGLEWLDLTQTGGKSINEVKSLLGSVYAGWRLPTYDEIKQLAANLYPTTTKISYPNHTAVYYGSEGSAHSLFGANVSLYHYGTYEVAGRTLMFGQNSSAGVMHFNWDRAGNLDFSIGYDGVYLVSDGGTTLSSINNPNLNINNPNAPVNQVPDVPADVPVHAGFGLLGLALIALGLRRRNSA